VSKARFISYQLYRRIIRSE